ncbi:hypothetical protein RJ639_022467 [Escallonia herrerae]|uniref:Uncharacterized protein n=1 Tax=Escallonia herrerae TaxID=1293975 RepID=A0AA89AGA8_9ASTE|nr:hypothetical protein RJ639_022467 [Escallonia herrerae]
MRRASSSRKTSSSSQAPPPAQAPAPRPSQTPIQAPTQPFVPGRMSTGCMIDTQANWEFNQNIPDFEYTPDEDPPHYSQGRSSVGEATTPWHNLNPMPGHDEEGPSNASGNEPEVQKGKKKKAECWNHFDVVTVDGIRKARLVMDILTGITLCVHLDKATSNLPKRSYLLTREQRDGLAEFVIHDEQAFSFADNPKHSRYMNTYVQPLYKKVHRNTTRSDALRQYNAAKARLIDYFDKFDGKANSMKLVSRIKKIEDDLLSNVASYSQRNRSLVDVSSDQSDLLLFKDGSVCGYGFGESDGNGIRLTKDKPVWQQAVAATGAYVNVTSATPESEIRPRRNRSLTPTLKNGDLRHRLNRQLFKTPHADFTKEIHELKNVVIQQKLDMAVAPRSTHHSHLHPSDLRLRLTSRLSYGRIYRLAADPTFDPEEKGEEHVTRSGSCYRRDPSDEDSTDSSPVQAAKAETPRRSIHRKKTPEFCT